MLSKKFTSCLIEPRLLRPRGHLVRVEAQPMVGVSLTHILTVMFFEIDNDTAPQGANDASRVSECALRLRQMVEHHVRDSDVDAMVSKGKVLKISEPKVNMTAFRSESTGSFIEHRL